MGIFEGCPILDKNIDDFVFLLGDHFFHFLLIVFQINTVRNLQGFGNLEGFALYEPLAKMD